MKIGINHGFICGEYEGRGFEKSLDVLKQLEFDGIMLYLSEEFVASRTRKIRKILADAGLELFSVHPPWPNFAFGDGMERLQAIHEWKRWSNYSLEMNAQNLVVHPCGEIFTLPSHEQDEAKKRLIEGLQYLSASTPEMMFVLENMVPRSFAATADELIWVADQIGGENIGFCLDTGHCMLVKGDLPKFVRCMGNRLLTTHIHDNDGIQDQHLFPGQGIIDWKTLLAVLQELPGDIPLVMEINRANTAGGATLEKRIELLDGTRKFLRELLRETN